MDAGWHEGLRSAWTGPVLLGANPCAMFDREFLCSVTRFQLRQLTSRADILRSTKEHRT